jgi:cation transport regulator ChaB
MPYRDVRDLPAPVKDALPEAAQEVYRRVVNSQLARGLDDSVAHASAWGALRRQGWEQDPKTGRWHQVSKALYLDIVEKRDDTHSVFGWASVAVGKDGTPVIDLQGDVIHIDDLEEAVYDYVPTYGVGGEMHQGAAANPLIESMVFTPAKLAKMGIPEGTVPMGWWVGYRISQDTFARVQEGSRLMFSIEGRGRREPLD